MTYIAPNTRIIGNLSGEGAFILRGQIEGECDINGSLTVAEGSHWKGAIRATDIILAGSVEGDVTAEQSVEIAGTARIIGRLRASSITVAEGAVIEGEVTIAKATETQRPKLDAQLSPRQILSMLNENTEGVTVRHRRLPKVIRFNRRRS